MRTFLADYADSDDVPGGQKGSLNDSNVDIQLVDPRVPQRHMIGSTPSGVALGIRP
jgi:hypothetical protein